MTRRAFAAREAWLKSLPDGFVEHINRRRAQEALPPLGPDLEPPPEAPIPEADPVAAWNDLVRGFLAARKAWRDACAAYGTTSPEADSLSEAVEAIKVQGPAVRRRVEAHLGRPLTEEENTRGVAV